MAASSSCGGSWGGLSSLRVLYLKKISGWKRKKASLGITAVLLDQKVLMLDAFAKVSGWLKVGWPCRVVASLFYQARMGTSAAPG